MRTLIHPLLFYWRVAMDVSDYTDDELYDLWNERAAVFEFDGGLSREDAQYRAGVEVASWLKPRALPEKIKRESRRARKQ